jgi:hypothetical protein
MNKAASPTCTLRLAAHGVAEPCPRERCAFWEAGGAIIDGGCIIERLGIDVGRPELTAYLLELREQLDEARDRQDTEALHSQLARRIGLEL